MIADMPIRSSQTGSRSSRSGVVARRLLGCFLVVVVVCVATVGWGVVAQQRTAKDSELLRSGYLPLVLAVEAALENQELVGAQLNHITEARNPADARQWIETARRLRPRIFEQIRYSASRAESLANDARARQIGSDIAAASAGLESFLAEDRTILFSLFASLEQGDGRRAKELRDEALAHEIAGGRRVQHLKKRVESEMDALIDSARERERLAMHSLLGLAALTLLVGILTTLYARRVLQPLAAVTRRAQMVASGDMTPGPVVAAKDEIGELAATFESMVAAIVKANHASLQSERLAAVGRMAAHVTHEIRNPLSSIGLNLELLEDELSCGEFADEPRLLLRAIRKEVDHLSSLSEEYLRLARPLKPRLEVEGLTEMVREVSSFVLPELRHSGIELVLDVPRSVPDIMVDEQQIRQALLNLIRNAREAMGKGGKLVIALSEQREWIELSVRDTGPGVPHDVRASIFDPFFTTKNRGTGLGLALARQVVESHGGTIVCEPVEPNGTVFRIKLPVAQPTTPKSTED